MKEKNIYKEKKKTTVYNLCVNYIEQKTVYFSCKILQKPWLIYFHVFYSALKNII